jgi:hypothetical protein
MDSNQGTIAQPNCRCLSPPLPKWACARAAHRSHHLTATVAPWLLPADRQRPRYTGPLPNPCHVVSPPYWPPPPHHCSTLPPPLRRVNRHRAQVFPPCALFSSAKEPCDTPPLLPLCISSVVGRRRATTAPESREAPLPTAPFGELRLHHLLFLGWPAPHFPLALRCCRCFHHRNATATASSALLTVGNYPR